MYKTYQQVLKKLHFDMHTPGHIQNVGKDLDVDRYVNAVKMSGAESVTLFARCAYAYSYFPTEFGMPHPQMERDVFGEICSALNKEKIDVTAYMAVGDISMDYANKYGFDRAASDENGERYYLRKNETSVMAACPTSDFLYGEIQPLILDCARKYDINAVWLDGVYTLFKSPCYCERCQAEFNKAHPEANGNMNSRARYKWLQDIIWEFLNDTAIKLDKVRPNCTIGGDVIGCLGWSVPYPKELGFVSFDPQTPNLPVNISLHMASVAWRGVTADMNIQRMRNWQSFNSRPLDILKTEAAVCASMNCMLIAGDLIRPVDISPDVESMKLIKKVFDYGESIYTKVKDIPNFAEIAILASPEQSRLNENEVWQTKFSHVESAYHMVISAGLSAHILYDDDVKENLEKYKLAIVPELSYISREASEAIEEFVKNGGKLIVMGKVTQSVDPYQASENADRDVFEKLIGGKYCGFMDEPLTYMNIKDTEAMRYWNDDVVPTLAVNGTAELVFTAPETIVETPLYAPAPAYQIGARPIGAKTAHPAISRNEYGKGTVIFMAQSIVSDFFEFGTCISNNLVHGIIGDLLSPYAKLTGNPSGQIVVAKNEDTLCVSAINFHNDLNNLGPRNADHVCQVAGIKATIVDDRIPVGVESVLGDDIKVTAENGKITLEFPPFTIYSGAIIKF